MDMVVAEFLSNQIRSQMAEVTSEALMSINYSVSRLQGFQMAVKAIAEFANKVSYLITAEQLQGIKHYAEFCINSIEVKKG